MKSDKRFLCLSSVFALLGMTLEEQAQARQTAQKIQATIEDKSTLSSSANPQSVMNNWQSQTQQKMLRSRTSAIQSGGTSALDNLKQQTHQFSRTLRSGQLTSEGRFEAPGLNEFSNFINQNSGKESKTDTSGDELDKIRVSTIQSIDKILRQPGSQQQRVDLMLRLAELHAERHSDFLVKEMNRYEAANNKWIKNHRSGPEPKFSQVNSQQALHSATQILRNLVNQYPNHPRTPEALYQLGYLLTEMKSDSAVLYFQRLIERFPKSKFIPDAQLALGEFFFSRNKFSDALFHYQKVLGDRSHRAYPYAVYKLGWTFFNLRGTDEETAKNLEKAVVAFKLLVKFSEESSSQKKLALLRKDALRDLVLVYAEIGDIEEAQKYFKSKNETPMYVSLLERLAWLHTDSGRYRQAIEIYNRLLEEFPLSSKNPQFLARLAGLHEKEQNRAMLVVSLQQLSDLLDQESRWLKAQKNTQETTAARATIVQESQVWSLRLHAEFQKSKNKTTAQQALNVYDIALSHLSETADAFQVLFNRSQLYTVLEEHEKAIEGYSAVVGIDKKFSLSRPETKIALENAIAESEILIQRRGLLTSGKGGGIPALEARLVKLIDIHAANYPRDAERTALMHRAALIHFNAGLIPHSMQRWSAMAKDAPQSPYVSEGLRLVLKHSFDTQQWSKAASDARAFLAIGGIQGSTLGQQISKLLRVSLFQQALRLEKTGQHSDAAIRFADYHKEFPSDEDSPKALINAANNHFKANRPEEALQALNRFVRGYPNSEYQQRALDMLSITAEGMGRFADAAKAVEQMAARKSNKEIYAQDMARAAELRLAENNPQQAMANAEAAIAHLKRSVEICTTYKTLVDAQMLARSSRLLTTSQAAMQKCELSSPEWGLWFTALTAKMNFSSGQVSEAARLAGVALSRGKVLAGKLQSPFAFEGLRIAGHIQLSVLEGHSRQILARRVTNSNDIQNEFGRIRGDAQQLAQQYMQLAQSGQAETAVGALYRIAEIQEGLAQILVQSPNPDRLSPGDTEAFRSKVEKIALPLQEEAAKLYAQAFEKASDAEILSPYTKILKEKLAVIQPSEFQRQIETMPKPSYFAHELPNSKEVKGVVEEN